MSHSIFSSRHVIKIFFQQTLVLTTRRCRHRHFWHRRLLVAAKKAFHMVKFKILKRTLCLLFLAWYSESQVQKFCTVNIDNAIVCMDSGVRTCVYCLHLFSSVYYTSHDSCLQSQVRCTLGSSTLVLGSICTHQMLMPSSQGKLNNMPSFPPPPPKALHKKKRMYCCFI